MLPMTARVNMDICKCYEEKLIASVRDRVQELFFSPHGNCILVCLRRGIVVAQKSSNTMFVVVSFIGSCTASDKSCVERGYIVKCIVVHTSQQLIVVQNNILWEVYPCPATKKLLATRYSITKNYYDKSASQMLRMVTQRHRQHSDISNVPACSQQ